MPIQNIEGTKSVRCPCCNNMYHMNLVDTLGTCPDCGEQNVYWFFGTIGEHFY